MVRTVVCGSYRVPLQEVSALCVHRGARAQELVAIGDEAFTIIVAKVFTTGFGAPTSLRIAPVPPIPWRVGRFLDNRNTPYAPRGRGCERILKKRSRAAGRQRAAASS